LLCYLGQTESISLNVLEKKPNHINKVRGGGDCIIIFVVGCWIVCCCGGSKK